MLPRFINIGVKSLANTIACHRRYYTDNVSSRHNNAHVILSGNGSQRDLLKFPRPERKELPDKVRFGFVPEEWLQFFYSKTGVSGPFVFVAGLATFLVSKELYVLDHEFYNGISVAIVSCVTVKTVGPQVAAFLDRAIDEVEDAWHFEREGPVNMYQSAIKREQEEQWRANGQRMLLEAKKELVAIQLETEYRERLMEAYHQVKRRLDFEIERHRTAQCVMHRHLICCVVCSVRASVGSALQSTVLRHCISQLAALSSHTRPLPALWTPPALSLWVILPAQHSEESSAFAVLQFACHCHITNYRQHISF